MNFDNTQTSIRDVQKIQLEMLVEFDRICKKHNIKYQLFAGTLLGSIRHKGFIPWDDDIDVCLLRKEYNKFMTVYKEELNSSYFLQNYETDENSIFHFSKLIKDNTIYRTKMYKDVNMHQGIFIDIFPMDNVKPFVLSGKIHSIICRYLFVIISSMNKSRCYVTRNKVVKHLRLALYYFTKAFPKKSIHRFVDKIICIFNKQDTGYVGCLANGASKEEFANFTVKTSTFYNFAQGEFEGYKFPIPDDYDSVLSKNYGDYMIFPPQEQQKPHHGIIEVCLDTKKVKGD